MGLLNLATTPEYNDTGNWTAACNATVEDCGGYNRNPQLQLAYDIIVPTILFVIMLAMGAGITLQEIRDRLRPPTAACMGLLSVFILYPALSFGIAHALRMKANHAIGMMIVASTPGGATSNIFTLWSKGDLPLSVVMTAFSTVLALGFMPLNLFIYLRSWSSGQAQIPYGNIAITIAITWVPLAIGVLIKHKAPKAAPIITKVGSFFGLAIILAAGIMQRQLYPEMFDLPWQVWVGGFLQPLLGFGLGMAAGSVACRPVKEMRTIAYENGMKNVGVALTIISISFSGEERNLLSQFPLVYAIAQMVTGLGAVVIHRIVFLALKRRRKQYKMEDEPEPEMEEKPAKALFASTNGNTEKALSFNDHYVSSVEKKGGL